MSDSELSRVAIYDSLSCKAVVSWAAVGERQNQHWFCDTSLSRMGESLPGLWRGRELGGGIGTCLDRHSAGTS